MMPVPTLRRFLAKARGLFGDPERNSGFDAETVEGAERLEGLEDHEVESPLEDLRLSGFERRSFGHCKEGSMFPLDCP